MIYCVIYREEKYIYRASSPTEAIKKYGQHIGRPFEIVCADCDFAIAFDAKGRRIYAFKE